MQMSPMNLDYKNILMQEKMVGKSKYLIKGRKESKLDPRPGNSPNEIAQVGGIWRIKKFPGSCLEDVSCHSKQLELTEV